MQDNYWKCEYENLRRKKQKEIDRMILAQSRFVHKTYDLLKLLGLTDEMIRRWYDTSGKDRRTDQPVQ